ncbi:MAG: acyl-CoA desaturase [Desulfobacteraceae bacterium]|nr:MAG: acyl-CoA desaturase [Desulfobacteraceae bacterium]
MCLGVFFVGWSPIAVGTALGLYLVRMFAITGFYHRYFSHNTFKASRFWAFVFAVLGNSAVQRGPLWWAAHHRHHHKYSDRKEDVHSPVQHGFLWSHMGWLTSLQNFPTRLDLVKDWARFPELRFLDRFDILVPLALAISLFLFGSILKSFVPSLGTSGLQMLVWGFFVSSTVLFHATCTINSLDHLWGSKRFRTGDESRNNPLLAVITLGEGWHNNHHHYSVAARQGIYWWEIDLTYYILTMMSWLGVVRNLNPYPRRIIDRDRMEG